MHQWKAGDQISIDDYFAGLGLRSSTMFNQPLQSLIELAPAGAEERRSESISNHIDGRGQGRDLSAKPEGSRAVNREELLQRISIDQNICFGKPCIRGHRIWVSLILDFLASGWSVEDVLDQHPGLEEADIRACIAYGAEMARERFVEIPMARAG